MEKRLLLDTERLCVHNEKSVRQGMSGTSGERNSIHIRK